MRRLHTMEMDWYTMDDRKEGRKEKRTFCTLDSNFFNDMHLIFMPLMIMIMIMRTEWERIIMDENVIGCDLELDSISVIHNWKWMSNAHIWLRNGSGLWLSLECYLGLNHWCWQGRSVYLSGPIMWITMGYLNVWTNE